MPSEVHIANRVREIRTKLGMRQEDLANAVGVSRQTIIALERGRLTNPSIQTCLMLARALGEPVDYLFYVVPVRRSGDTRPETDGQTPAASQPEPPDAQPEPEPPTPEPAALAPAPKPEPTPRPAPEPPAPLPEAVEDAPVMQEPADEPADETPALPDEEPAAEPAPSRTPSEPESGGDDEGPTQAVWDF